MAVRTIFAVVHKHHGRRSAEVAHRQQTTWRVLISALETPVGSSQAAVMDRCATLLSSFHADLHVYSIQSQAFSVIYSAMCRSITDGCFILQRRESNVSARVLLIQCRIRRHMSDKLYNPVHVIKAHAGIH